MADDSLTILARLVAQDAASPAINQLGASVDKLDQKVETSRKGFLNMGRAADENRLSLSRMETAVTGAVTAFAGLQTVQFLSGMIQHGEAVRKTTNTYLALTGGVREAEATLAALQARTHGMVSDTNLMAGANQLLSANLAKSNEEAVKLLGLATDLGASTEQLFSVLANQSYAVLDSFGVSSGAVRQLRQDFIDAGVSADDAFKEAFLVEAQKTVERLGDSIEQNISPSQQLSIRWQNFWDVQSNYAAQTLNTAITAAEQLSFLVGYTVDESLNKWRDIFEQMGLAPEVRGGQTPFYMSPEEYQQRYGMPINAAAGDVGPKASAGPSVEETRQFFQAWMERAQGGVGDWQEKLGVALDEGAKAAREQARAAEENTRALQRQADAINDTIARMMGWTPPEQRALEAAQTDVATALQAAGLSPEMIDTVMRTGQAQLPQYLQQGFSPADATYQAYGVTPGAGSTPFAVKPGDTVSGLAAQYGLSQDQIMAAANITNPRLLQPGQYGASGARFTGQRQMEMTPTGASFYNEAYREADQGRDVAEKINSIVGFLTEVANTVMLPGDGSGGGNPNINWGMDLQAAYGGSRVPPQLPYQAASFRNASVARVPPGTAIHGPTAIPTSGFFPPAQTEYPAGLGNADVNGGAYPMGMGNMDSQQLAQDTMTIADNTGVAADPQHMGAWPGLVTDTNSQVATLQSGIDKVAQTHKIAFDLSLTPTSRDKLSQWVFEILRSSGVNLGGKKP